MFRSTVAEQIAAHLREELRSGRIGEKLPSIRKLAADLDTSKASVMSALRLLETEGVLTPPGKRKPRRAVENANLSGNARKLRIGFLLDNRVEDEDPWDVQEIMQFARHVERNGHVCVFAPKAQSELRHNVQQVTRMVAEMDVDLWVLWGGPRALLEWFSSQPIPTFAVSANCKGLKIAGASYDTPAAMTQAVRYLTSLGHRRIVRIGNPTLFRQPNTMTNQRFVEGLAEVGITANDYHLPEWPQTPEGLQELLTSLFHLTPPTAIIASEAHHVNGIYSFLLSRGLQVPRDLSLIVLFSSPALQWCRPALAHVEAEMHPLTRAALRWVESAAKGRPHQKQEMFEAKFNPGNSIASPRK